MKNWGQNYKQFPKYMTEKVSDSNNIIANLESTNPHINKENEGM